MKSLIVIVTLFTSSIAFSKTLTVDCTSKNGKSLNMISEILNVNSPQTIKSLKVNGVPQSKFRDISTMPIYKDGTFSLKIQFDSKLYSTAKIEVTSCNDDFFATGKADMKEYVGGFAGSIPLGLDCTCSLK